MHIAGIKKCDIANGLGVRLTVFVSGCKNHCPGCFQPETWDFDYGTLYDKDVKNDILKELHRGPYQGISILGGDPMEIENQDGVYDLLQTVKETMPDKDVWMYTGYTFETDLSKGGKRYTEYTDKILSMVDILVDGRFELKKKDITLKFRGSSNQRLIDLRASRLSGSTVLKEVA